MLTGWQTLEAEGRCEVLFSSKRSRNTLLTPEEEIALAQRVEQGDIEARGRFIEANLRLVAKVANSYRGCGLPYPDLIQEGNIGLIEAIGKFNWRKGYRFSTYAVWWIRHAIIQALPKSAHAITFPHGIYELINRVSTQIISFIDSYGREPTVSEMALLPQFSDIDSEEKATRILEVMMMRQLVSLSAPLTYDETLETLGDLIADNQESVDEIVISRLYNEKIQEHLQRLSPHEQAVIKMRYGLEETEMRTLTEIGDFLNISGERVRQIEKNALRKLRFSLSQDKTFLAFSC